MKVRVRDIAGVLAAPTLPAGLVVLGAEQALRQPKGKPLLPNSARSMEKQACRELTLVRASAEQRESHRDRRARPEAFAKYAILPCTRYVAGFRCPAIASAEDVRFRITHLLMARFLTVFAPSVDQTSGESMAGDLTGRKVAVLATDGVEQVELTAPWNALKEGGRTFRSSP